MYWIIILIIIAAAVIVLFLKKNQAASGSEVPTEYEKVESVFTPAERSFFGVLKQSIGDEVQVFAKVRVADVVSPKKGMKRSDWQKAFNKISGKHFDFLICEKNSLSVVCGIELNDKSHQKEKRQRRDEFLGKICEIAGLPLIEFSVQSGYSPNEIRNAVYKYLPNLTLKQTSGIVDSNSIDSSVAEEKRCPKCSELLVERIAKKGANIGKNFWACSGYPKCKYIEQTE